jgi:Fe-S cluster assembly protein SufD
MTKADTRKSVAAELKQAAEAYVEAHGRFATNGAAAAPKWLKERRDQAISRFAEVGFPSTRLEEWRFTDIKAIARTSFALAGEADLSGLEATVSAHVVGAVDQHVAVFVNGRFAPALSRLGQLPSGVLAGSLGDALSSDTERVQGLLGHLAPEEANPFTALNTAFVHDGAFLYVPKDTKVERPVHFLFLSVPVSDVPLVVHPRNLMVVDRGAQATVLETYATHGEGVFWTNAVTEVSVGENATLDAYRIQRESEDAFHTAATHSRQERSSNYSFITFSLGGGLTRHDIKVVLDGEGADATLDGLSMLRGRQHTDYHTTLEHAKPNCTSWEYFNGVFDDRARGVFNGRIIVRPGAQKTDSKQTNNSLLLSSSARADSQPQLEIYADDVRCTHGATLGPIDGDHMFYLQSRGLTAKEAEALLTYGFGSEILNAVKSAPLRQALDRLVRRWLAEA